MIGEENIRVDAGNASRAKGNTGGLMVHGCRRGMKWMDCVENGADERWERESQRRVFRRHEGCAATHDKEQ